MGCMLLGVEIYCICRCDSWLKTVSYKPGGGGLKHRNFILYQTDLNIMAR